MPYLNSRMLNDMTITDIRSHITNEQRILRNDFNDQIKNFKTVLSLSLLSPIFVVPRILQEILCVLQRSITHEDTDIPS